MYTQFSFKEVSFRSRESLQGKQKKFRPLFQLLVALFFLDCTPFPLVLHDPLTSPSIRDVFMWQMIAAYQTPESYQRAALWRAWAKKTEHCMNIPAWASCTSLKGGDKGQAEKKALQSYWSPSHLPIISKMIEGEKRIPWSCLHCHYCRQPCMQTAWESGAHKAQSKWVWVAKRMCGKQVFPPAQWNPYQNIHGLAIKH